MKIYNIKNTKKVIQGLSKSPSIAASVCVETILSELLRLLLKDTPLGNNRKIDKNRKFTIVHCTTFKIKKQWCKNEDYFFFEKDQKSYFSQEKMYGICFNLKYPPIGYHYHCPLLMELPRKKRKTTSPPTKKRKLSRQWFNDLNFSKLKSLSQILGGEGTIFVL